MKCECSWCQSEFWQFMCIVALAAGVVFLSIDNLNQQRHIEALETAVSNMVKQ